MKIRLFFIVTLLCLLAKTSLVAQEEFPKDWNSAKIKGVRFVPYDYYQGNSYLTDNFVPQ